MHPNSEKAGFFYCASCIAAPKISQWGEFSSKWLCLDIDIKISLKMIMFRITVWWPHTATVTASRKPWEIKYDDLLLHFFFKFWLIDLFIGGASNLLLMPMYRCWWWGFRYLCSKKTTALLPAKPTGFLVFFPLFPCLAVRRKKEKKFEIF